MRKYLIFNCLKIYGAGEGNRTLNTDSQNSQYIDNKQLEKTTFLPICVILGQFGPFVCYYSLLLLPYQQPQSTQATTRRAASRSGCSKASEN